MKKLRLAKNLFIIGIFIASIITAAIGVVSFFSNDYKFVYIGALLYLYQIISAAVVTYKKGKNPIPYSTFIIMLIFAVASYLFKINILIGICLGLCVESLGVFIIQFGKLFLGIKAKKG